MIIFAGIAQLARLPTRGLCSALGSSAAASETWRLWGASSGEPVSHGCCETGMQSRWGLTSAEQPTRRLRRCRRAVAPCGSFCVPASSSQECRTEAGHQTSALLNRVWSCRRTSFYSGRSTRTQTAGDDGRGMGVSSVGAGAKMTGPGHMVGDPHSGDGTRRTPLGCCLKR